MQLIKRHAESCGNDKPQHIFKLKVLQRQGKKKPYPFILFTQYLVGTSVSLEFMLWSHKDPAIGSNPSYDVLNHDSTVYLQAYSRPAIGKGVIKSVEGRSSR